MIDRLFYTKYSILFWLVMVTVVLYHKSFLGLQYIDWDTHHVFFTEFLFYVDAFENKLFPSINHMIQSGSFNPMFGKTFYYTIFCFPFLLLAQIVNPLIVFEILVHFYGLVAAFGIYLYINTLLKDRSIAIFASIAYCLALSHIISGQLAYVFSLSILPWLLFLFHYLAEKNKTLSFLDKFFIGFLFGSYIIFCDPWHLMNAFIFSFVYATLWSYKNRLKAEYMTYLFLFALMTVMYVLVNLEAILLMKEQYSWITHGGYTSLEPRLRSIGEYSPNLLIDNLLYSFLASVSIDFILPFTQSVGWYKGVGVVVFITLVIVFFKNKIENKNILLVTVLFLLLGIIFLFYAAAVNTRFYTIIKYIPFYNAHRWYAMGLEYSIISMIVLSSIGLYCIKKENINYKFLTAITLVVLFLTLFKFIPANKLYLFLVPIVLFVIYKKYNIKKEMILLILIVLNIIQFQKIKPDGLMFDNGALANAIENRNKSLVIEENKRYQPKSDIYVVYDHKMLIDRIPTSHGYNNIGNPIYWYFMNTQFSGTFFGLTDDLRENKFELKQPSGISANEHIKVYTNDIISNYPATTLFKNDLKNIKNDNETLEFSINNIKIEPDRAEVNLNVSKQAFLNFNSTYFKDWKVFVNGEEKKVIRANSEFMGVYLEEKGDYNILFIYKNTFFDYTIYFIWFILFVGFLNFIFKYIKNKKEQDI